MTNQSTPVPPVQPAPPVREGEIIAGKYRVGRILGQGGMGVIVAATHLQLEQRVALKFLLPAALANPEVVARFTREAQAAAKIQSEHVARVIDVGTLETGAPYMVMEFLEGEDLEQTLAARGRLPIEEAVDCLLQGCEAVAEAHALGIIHRDLKPANLFLAKRPGGRAIVKVLDFGISKATAVMGGAALTRTAATFGSPLYMSPEQMTSSRSVDARADVWSLGAVLYELLTARHLFDCESIAELIVAIMQQSPLPPRTHRPELPPRLDAAILRCLERDPARRFPHVAALAAAIAPFGSPGGTAAVERIAHVLGVAHERPASGADATEAAALAGGTIVLPATTAGAGTAARAGAEDGEDRDPPEDDAGRSRARARVRAAPERGDQKQGGRGRTLRVVAPMVAVAAAGIALAVWRFAGGQAPPAPAPAPTSASTIESPRERTPAANTPNAPAANTPAATTAPPAPNLPSAANAPPPALPLPSVAAPTSAGARPALPGTPEVAAREAPAPEDPSLSRSHAAASAHRAPALSRSHAAPRAAAPAATTAPKPAAAVAAVPAPAASPAAPAAKTPEPAGARPAHPTAPVEAATCASLLERLSLGETLTRPEKALYARECRR